MVQYLEDSRCLTNDYGTALLNYFLMFSNQSDPKIKAEAVNMKAGDRYMG
jgi:hypothetical protein